MLKYKIRYFKLKAGIEDFNHWNFREIFMSNILRVHFLQVKLISDALYAQALFTEKQRSINLKGGVRALN
ncbi:MAG TPA: hypothetical protein DEH07_09895 [Desulfotomaculum sp.]|nr:hypothetical protein [Desulfotomaculum sp.]